MNHIGRKVKLTKEYAEKVEHRLKGCSIIGTVEEIGNNILTVMMESGMTTMPYKPGKGYREECEWHEEPDISLHISKLKEVSKTQHNEQQKHRCSTADRSNQTTDK